MRRRVDIGWRLYSLIVGALIVLSVAGFGYAYGSGDPLVNGHDSEELDLSDICMSDGTGCYEKMCLRYTIDMTEKNKFYNVSLLRNGENICETPFGCRMYGYVEVKATGLLDIDGAMMDKGYYIQKSDGVYRENMGGEAGKTNGDATDTVLSTWKGKIKLYDDYDGVESGVDYWSLKSLNNKFIYTFIICPLN